MIRRNVLCLAAMLAARQGVAVNSLPNSSFEAGLEGYRIVTSYAVNGSGSVVATEDAVDGSYVVELVSPVPAEIDPPAEVYLASHWEPMNPGEATFSFYARTVEGSPEVTVSFRDTQMRKTFRPGPEWKRFQITVPLALKEPCERVALRASGGGRMQVDALQFEQGGLTPYAPPSEPLMGITTDRDNALMLPGESVQVGFRAWLPEACTAVVQWEVGNLDKKVVRSEEIAISAEGVFTHSESWTAPAEPGWREWRARLLVDGKPVASSRYSVAVVPPQPAYEAGAVNLFSFCLSHEDLVRHVEQARRMGVSLLRVHGILNLPSFPAQASRATWRDEEIIRYIHSRGLSQYAQLGKHGYARKMVERLNSPQRWEEFSQNITAMAEQYRGLMQGYEIWNEPSGPLSLETYAPMHRAIAAALRAGDPSARQIGLCGMPKHADWIAKCVETGLADELDAVSFHNYIRIAPELAMPQTLAALFGENNRVMRDAGLLDKPLWDTESGYLQNVDKRMRPQSSGPAFFYKTVEEQSYLTVRHNLMSFAAGLEVKSTFFLPAVNIEQWWAWSPFRADAHSSALPMALSYSVMTSQLRGCEPREIVFEHDNNVFAYRFEGDDKTVVVLWTVHGLKTLDVDLPQPDSVVDLYGRKQELPDGTLRVGPQPIYLVYDHADAVAESWSEQLQVSDGAAFRPYDVWNAPRKTMAVADSASAKQPPVSADIVLSAAESRFFTWNPGLQAAEGALNEQVLVMNAPTAPSRLNCVAEFQTRLRENDGGTWQIWASIGPMFFNEYSELAVQVDDFPPVRTRGLDNPDTYSITFPSGESAELAWQYFTTVNLAPGVHRIRILSGAELDGQQDSVNRQVLDAMVLHRMDNKTEVE